MKSRFAVLGLAAFAIAAASVSATVVPTAPAPRTAPAVWEPLAFEPSALPAGVSIDHEGVFVIGSPEQYANFLSTVPTGGRDGASFPNVDFATSFLVVASGGLKDLGNDLTITKASTDGVHVIIGLTQQVDNPNHCRVTHDIHFIGQLAVVGRPAGADLSDSSAVGFQRSTIEMPYDDWYNCYCPEM